MRLGAFQPPAGLAVDIEHLFCRSDGPYPLQDLARIRNAGRTPLLTVEPWTGIGQLPQIIRGLGPCWLRYGHEFNGRWYPWAGNAQALIADWRRIARLKPDDVELVWCANVAYPGSVPLGDFWPGGAFVDILGLDGYDQAGTPPNPPASFKSICGPTLDYLSKLAPNKPVVICETATPKGRGQAAWIREMWRSLEERSQVEAVCWFNAKKEQDWTLGKAGLAAFAQDGAGRAGPL